MDSPPIIGKPCSMEGGGKEGAEPPFARNTPPLIFPTAGTHPLRTHTRSGLAHDFPLKNTGQSSANGAAPDKRYPPPQIQISKHTPPQKTLTNLRLPAHTPDAHPLQTGTQFPVGEHTRQSSANGTGPDSPTPRLPDSPTPPPPTQTDSNEKHKKNPGEDLSIFSGIGFQRLRTPEPL